MLAAPNAGVLPPDVLFDVLLRLSAKLLCRLRAVCRSWRALTSDPLFTGAHAARHPLFLANFRDDHTHVNVVDLSGSVVKRIPNVYGLLLPTSLDLACAMTVWDSCHVFDPSTGTVCVLPEPSGGGCGSKESKQAARLFRLHLFEVLTVNIGSGSSSSQPQWRAMPGGDEFVEPGSAIVVGEVVYFKIDTTFAALSRDFRHGISVDCIVPFDLAKEEWREILRGPTSDILPTYDQLDNGCLWTETILADLRGSLGLVDYRRSQHIIVWLLKDFDSVLWVKEYTIQIEPIVSTELCVKSSLFMLDDGRLVIHFPRTELFLIYDPRTNTSTQAEMRHLDAVAMYTGNLLSLQVGDIV
ncbi:hypothetical protein HU200_015651 [Digitaria exilis]|uniref:F-box domain-containing protein n=1 Tax=Digitaria exilis TaxID=1010633 RepID=A0A835F8H2_9POAL|nr:hypothetical protein HU200_015651 [Digitaria exilis]